MDITAGKINKISDEGNTMMEVDLKKSLTYGAETTSANGWPDGRYSIGGGTEGRILSAGCGTSYEMAGAEIVGTVHRASEESVV